MEKAIYENKPLATEEVVSAGVRTTIIRFGIEETENGWECEEICINHKEPLTKDKDYGPMVSAIIRSRYSHDMIEAITQNYLADPDGRKQEFDDLQAWRQKAKEMAGSIFLDDSTSR